jgi:hypothetical protein
LLPKGKSTSSSSGSALSKYGPKTQGKSPTISDIISTMYSDNSVNNYIDVSVSATLQASTRRRNNAKALLDTGSRTVKELHLDPFILTDRSKLVCSGLDNSCYDVSSYIALLVSYFSETSNKYVTIELKATILNSSPIDLVIGRDSIRKYDLFSEIPSPLASPVMASTVKLGSVPTCCQATGSLMMALPP